MPSHTLSVKTRTAGRASVLRSQGRLPAVIYGKGLPSRAVEVGLLDFAKVYSTAGESSLINLAVDGGASVKALIQDVQVDPVSGRPVHVDFREVKMTEKLTTTIPLVFADEAPAVKELGGTLVKNLTQVKVECLPGALVPEIAVSIATLKTFNDLLRLRDIKPPPGITFLDNLDTVVALVTAPRTEEEIKALEGAVEEKIEVVEVVEKKKKEEEEAVAGEKE